MEARKINWIRLIDEKPQVGKIIVSIYCESEKRAYICDAEVTETQILVDNNTLPKDVYITHWSYDNKD